MYSRDCFVFIDETGCSSKDHTRKFGYALKGYQAVDHRFVHRGTRVSAIAAISCMGLAAMELFTGTANGDTFTFRLLHFTEEGVHFPPAPSLHPH